MSFTSGIREAIASVPHDYDDDMAFEFIDESPAAPHAGGFEFLDSPPPSSPKGFDFVDEAPKASTPDTGFEFLDKPPDPSLGEPELRQGSRQTILGRLARGVRSLLDPLIGPSEAEKVANQVRIQEPDGTVRYAYKPLGDVVAREGLLGVHGHMAEQVAPAAEGASAIEKLGRGVARGALRGMDAMFNPLLLAMGPFAEGAPLVHRAISAGFAAQMLSQLPDLKDEIEKAVKSGDWERVAEATTATGLLGYFGYRGLREAVKPGLAQESPKLRELLTKKITEEFSPEQIKEVYGKVNRGEGTPAEAEFVRYLNAELESPGEAARKGVKFESTEPRVQNEALRKWLGLDEATERTLIFPSRAATAREPIAPEPQPSTPEGDQSNALQKYQNAEIPLREQTLPGQALAEAVRPGQELATESGQIEPVRSAATQAGPGTPVIPTESSPAVALPPTEAPSPPTAPVRQGAAMKLPSLEQVMKDIPVPLLEKRQKLLDQAVSENANLSQLMPVEAAISRLDGGWSLSATAEAVRHSGHGPGAIEFLQDIATNDDPTQTEIINRARRILEALPIDRFTKSILGREGATPGRDARYDDVLLEKGKELLDGTQSLGKPLLEAVQTRSSNPWYKKLAGTLIERKVFPTVMTFRTTAEARSFIIANPNFEHISNYQGYCDYETDTVFLLGLDRIQGDLEYLVLHETMHSAAVTALQDEAFYTKVEDLWLEMLEVEGHGRHYGSKSPDEFVPEAFSNQAFREFLDGIPHGKGTLLDAVIALLLPRLQPNIKFRDHLRGLRGGAVVATTPEVGQRGLVRSEIEGQLEFEKQTQNAQVSTLLNLLERYGTSPANPILQLLGYDDLKSIQIQTNAPRLTYEQFKAANPDAAYLPAVALESALKFILERDKWRELRGRLAEQEQLIQSPGFQKKIQRMEANEIKKEALQTAWENFRASIKDAIELAKVALQGEAKNEVRARRLLEYIASLESAKGYQSAMEHVLEDMVERLARHPDIAEFLAKASPTAGELVAMYNRIRQTTVASDIAAEWAGELLARSWTETQRMILAAMLRENLKLQRSMTAYEKEIFRGLRDRPRATMGQILSEARKNSKATALTTLAWQKLRTEVSRELTEWDDLQQAAGIIDKVEADQEYKAHANAVFTDAKIEDRPEALVKVGDKSVRVSDLNYDAIAGKPIFPMPDGTVVQVDLIGDVRAFDAERKKMEDALEALRVWKEAQDLLPAAQRDRGYQFFVGHLKALEGIYLSTRVTHPSSLISIGNPFSGEQPGSWDMPTFLLNDLGTRVGGAAKVAASNFARVHALARNLLVRQYQLANAMYKAADGYNFKGSRNDRALQLYDHVLQPLFAAAQRPGFKLTANMVVGEGYTVSKDVVALLHLQRDLASEAFKIIQEAVPKERPTSAFPTVIKDFIQGVAFHGQAIKVNETTLPFSGFNDRAIAFVQDYVQQADPALALESLAKNYELIFSYLSDRASIVKFISPYENAYQLLVERLRVTPPTTTQRNLNWVAQQISGINGAPVDEVVKTMGAELDKVIKSVAQMRQLEEESNPAISISQPHQETSFTARRHDREVPYYFTRFGWRTGADFLNFIGNTHAHNFERFIEALGEVQKDLQRQRDAMSAKYEARLRELLLAGSPDPKAKRQAMEQTLRANRLAHLNGETSDQFRSINKRLRMVRRTIEEQKKLFTGGEAEMDLRTWTKMSRTVVGSLLTPVTVMIRNGTGLAYLGSVMARMRRNAATSSVDVATRLVWDGLLRQGIAVPMFKLLKYAMGRGGLRSWFEATLDRVDRNKRLEEAGLVQPIDVANEFTAKIRNMANGGIVLDQRRGPGEQATLTLVGLFDALLLTAVAKPLFPRLGDTIINGASDSATVAMTKELESRLRELFLLWQEAGTLDSRFDFNNPTSEKNVISHYEMFPSRLFGVSARQKMEYLRQTFEWSGNTFDAAAFDFLRRLRAGDTNVTLLNPGEMVGLTDQILGLVNVPGALNRPSWTHKKDFLNQLFAPLVGWNIHALRQFVRYFSRPGVAPGETRTAMWFIMGMTLLPILLAMLVAQDTGTEELVRLAYRAMGKERGTRQPWEQPPNRVALGLLISAANPVPYISMAVNAALNDAPNRASFDPTPVLINKAKDVATYIGGVVQTGDATYGLERVVSSLVPIIAPLLAKEGIQDSLNARRLMTRYGDPDMLRPKYAGAQPATPLTPYGQKLMDAAMRGDDAEFQSVYQEAVAKAREIGKANPEQAVRQIFMAANPYDRAFKQKLSPEQREEMLSKMDPRERGIVERAEQRFSHAGSLIGAEPTFERTPSRGGASTGGRLALGRSRLARGRSTRFSTGRGLSARRPKLARGRGGRVARLARTGGARRLSRGLR